MTCIFTFPNWDKSDMSHPLPWAQATYFENRVCSGFRVSPCGRWPCFRITSISPIFHSIDINSAFQFRRGLYSSIQEAGCGSKGRCGTQEAHPWCGKGWGKEWAQETGQGQTSWQLGRPGRLTVFLGSRPLHIPFVSIILNSVLCDFVCFLDQNPSQSTLSKYMNWGAVCILKWQYSNVPNWVAEPVEPLASLLATILKLWMGIIGRKGWAAYRDWLLHLEMGPQKGRQDTVSCFKRHDSMCLMWTLVFSQLLAAECTGLAQVQVRGYLVDFLNIYCPSVGRELWAKTRQILYIVLQNFYIVLDHFIHSSEKFIYSSGPVLAAHRQRGPRTHQCIYIYI